MTNTLQESKNEKYELYDGQVIVEKNIKSRGHSYTVNGNKVTGVTTFLKIIDKPALIYWASEQACLYIQQAVKRGEKITDELLEKAKWAHRNITQEAADSGTLVHKWAEDYINGKNPDIPENTDVLNGVLAFTRWVDEHKVQFLSSERIVYSREHDYIGTMDAEAIIDGKRCVIDFKTGSGIWDEYLLQTAAYQKAAEEEGTKFDGDRWIVRFAKKDKIDKKTGEVLERGGDFEAKSFGDLDRYFQGFLAAKSLYQCLN